jgi:hypothetical protein
MRPEQEVAAEFVLKVIRVQAGQNFHILEQLLVVIISF